jgi:hypothetical protein
MVESLREVSGNSWILFGKFIITHYEHGKQASPPGGASWSDGKLGFFTMANVSDPAPDSKRLLWPGLQGGDRYQVFQPCPLITEVFCGGYHEAIWGIGEAVLTARQADPQDTREYDTLAFLKDQSLSFAIPNVLYFAECGKDHFFVTDVVKGAPIFTQWHLMDDAARKKCASGIGNACKELAEITSPRVKGICGVDGRDVEEPALCPRQHPTHSPQEQLEYCERFLELDLSTPLVLCNPLLEMDNITVDVQGDVVGISRWSMCGFFPKEWLRTRGQLTKFISPFWTKKDFTVWENLIEEQLQEAGFTKRDRTLLPAWQCRASTPQTSDP